MDQLHVLASACYKSRPKRHVKLTEKGMQNKQVRKILGPNPLEKQKGFISQRKL
jgi:hypothetical protein